MTGDGDAAWAGSVCIVLASSTGGVGQHVTSLVRGLVADGATVTVCGPAATEEQFGFTRTGSNVRFVPIEIPANPTPSDGRAVGALRRVLTGPIDVVHAHGLRAGLVAALARPAQPLVVTWHNAVLATGLRGQASRLAERVVARAARVTLGASQDLVDRASALGAADARLAPVAAPAAAAPRRSRAAVRAEFGIGRDRPLILSVGRLHPQKRYDVLVDAAARWRALDPSPVVVIAGIRARLPPAGRAHLRRARAGHCCSATAPTCPTCSRPPTSPWSPATGRPASSSPRRRCTPACRWSPPPSAGCPSWSATPPCWCRPATWTRSTPPSPTCSPTRTAATSCGAAAPPARRTWPAEQQTVDQVRAVYAEVTPVRRPPAEHGR